MSRRTPLLLTLILALSAASCATTTPWEVAGHNSLSVSSPDLQIATSGDLLLVGSEIDSGQIAFGAGERTAEYTSRYYVFAASRDRRVQQLLLVRTERVTTWWDRVKGIFYEPPPALVSGAFELGGTPFESYVSIGQPPDWPRVSAVLNRAGLAFGGCAIFRDMVSYEGKVPRHGGETFTFEPNVRLGLTWIEPVSDTATLPCDTPLTHVGLTAAQQEILAGFDARLRSSVSLVRK
jgi:hypothetical protein